MSDENEELEVPEPEESENEEEVEVELDLEDDGYEYIYGIAMPQLPDGLMPLECVVLLKGIMMESGQPTITALGSEGMTPWEAAGMLNMEAARLTQGYVFGGLGSTGFFDDDDDDDDDDD